MSKPTAKPAPPEHGFPTGVRGTNVGVLEPDVASFFSNAQTVNDSLRALAGIIRRPKAVAK